MKNQIKQKIKQYSFWTGLAGAIGILLQNICSALGVTFDQQIVSDIIMGICGVLVVFGVVCLPMKTEDKEPEEETKENNENEQKKNSDNENSNNTKELNNNSDVNVIKQSKIPNKKDISKK